MNDNVKLYLKFIFNAGFIFLAIITWLAFLIEFIDTTEFSSWIIWGFACSIIMLPSSIKFIIKGAKEGYNSGKNSYYGTLYENSYGKIGVSIHNQRYLEAIIGFCLSIFVMLLAGPIVLPFKIIFLIINIIPYIKLLLKEKKFFLKSLLITAIVIVMISCGFIVTNLIKNSEFLSNGYHIQSEIIKNEYQISVINDEDKVLNTNRYTLSVNDEKIATIDERGKLKKVNGGYVKVRATSIYNNDDYIEKSIFIPYKLSNDNTETKITKIDSDYSDFFKSLGSVVVDEAIKILCVTQESNIIKVLKELSDYFITFDKDGKYLFSSAIECCSVNNDILYVISDWTNNDIDMSNKKITEEDINSILIDKFYNYNSGDSIKNYSVEQINSFIQSQLSKDKKYYLSKMDSNYEYRIIVKGDYRYGISTSYYRKGLLTGLVNAIGDLVEGDWDSFSNEWLNEQNYNEICDISNLRICIEYRNKD